MSTRAQIELTNEEDRVLIYQHTDGYPEWLVPHLIQRALRLLEDDLINPAYMHMRAAPERVGLYFAAAQLRNNRESNQRIRRIRQDDPEFVRSAPESRWLEPLCSGFEFCDAHGLHGDTRWFYLVHIDTEEQIEREFYAQPHRRKGYHSRWRAEVLEPSPRYDELPTDTELPRYISQAGDLVEKQGELLVTHKKIQYPGELPQPGALYERHYQTHDQQPAVEQLQILWVHDWLITADVTKIVAGEPDYQGTRKISPFGLQRYEPVPASR